MITFTIDLEDPTEHYASDGRYVTMTRRILDLCEALKRRATFFVVGKVLEAAPYLIRDIAGKGHEIAYHSHNHKPLTEESPRRFEIETNEDKDKIEQLTGQKVIGFRAPQFSLTKQSLWTVDCLKKLGFQYSSSIMPTRISRFGIPEAPRTPFMWPNGLIELPLPVADLGNLRIPYLGGIYLYALPVSLTQSWVRKANPAEILWTYTHPYDFDREDKFTAMTNTPLWISIILGMARFVADNKIERLLRGNSAAPLGERCRGLNNLPVIRF